MFQAGRGEVSDFRAEYANSGDFCEIFQKEMESLYLLAFLLTANHQRAEQCFTSTIEDALAEPAVFKDWAPSWVRRCIIKNAIRLSSPATARIERREPSDPGPEAGNRELDVIVELAPLERFTFVMSTLEDYSVRDCSLLLGCSVETVLRAQVRALRRLAEMGAPIPETGFRMLRALLATA